MVKKVWSKSATAFKLLSGVFCVYKPAGQTASRVRKSFLHKIAEDLTLMTNRNRTNQSGNLQLLTNELAIPEPEPDPPLQNLLLNPLVVGPAFLPTDFRLRWATNLGTNTSGVFVLGINEGTVEAQALHDAHFMRVYHITAKLGQGTNNFYKTGKVIDSSSFKHVRRERLESILAAVEASHQRQMYELSGVDPQSQEAYELALKGPIRPVQTETPMIYNIKCVSFEPPYFTLEVECVNEYEAYLLSLTRDIGVKLHSAAHCTSLRCIRHSFFTLDQALLMKHWTVDEVLKNILICSRILRKEWKHSLNLMPLESNSSSVEQSS